MGQTERKGERPFERTAVHRGIGIKVPQSLLSKHLLLLVSKLWIQPAECCVPILRAAHIPRAIMPLPIGNSYTPFL